MICSNCNEEFEGTKRAKYCSDKCRVTFNRKESIVTNVTETTPIVTERVTETQQDVTQKLSKTDQLFKQDAQDRGLGDFYNFGDTVKDKVCSVCAKSFTTMLPLLRTCSPTCKSKELIIA